MRKKFWRACLIGTVFCLGLSGAFVGGTAQGVNRDELIEMDFPKSARPSICAFEELTLPDNAKVYAVATYGGAETGWQIDQSGHEATMVKVAANSPEAPVVLMLGAYEPTIWQIGWTEGTEILAVLASGYHGQAVNGLRPEVLVLVSSSTETGGPCRDFYSAVHPGFIKLINDNMSLELFGRSPVRITEAGKGTVVAGEPLQPNQKVVTAKVPVKEDFQRPDMPLAGEMGINEAVKKGQLRPATNYDRQKWQEANEALERKRALDSGIPEHLLPVKEKPAADKSNYDPARVISRAYTILDPNFIVPAGLYGGNSVSFYVPPGVPVPRGQTGHCTFYIMEDGSRTGP